MSAEKNKYEIVPTDLAYGDDYLAVLAHLGLNRSNPDVQEVFVATYGNRSTAVTFRNIEKFFVTANQLSATPITRDPQVLYGADRPQGAANEYTLSPDGIEYLIHGDFGFDSTTQASGISSEEGYQEISQTGQDVSILSLAATTELPKTIRSLSATNIIRSLAIMGGTLKLQGNVGPFTEANFFHDPKSTLETFQLCEQHNIPTLLVPLDTTEQEQVLFTQDRLHWLRERLHKSPWIIDIINNVAGPDGAYGNFYLNRTRQEDIFPYKEVGYTGVPVHDLTAAMAKYDFENGRNIFSFEQVIVSPNSLGEIGVARPYMTPNFEVTMAGPVKDYELLWELIATSFEQYS